MKTFTVNVTSTIEESWQLLLKSDYSEAPTPVSVYVK